MKSLVLALAFLAATVTHANVAGDKIHFQSDSTWVSAVYNKSLCVNGNNFEALITKCVERTGGDSDSCIRTIKVRATQPINSTRLRCDAFAGRDEGTCRKWVRVPYVQKPVRTVSFYTDRDQLIKTVKVTVPACK